MPKLSQHQSSETTKMLLVGDSGTGKTGALASLALAGYNLRILDLDNGLDIVINMLRGRNEVGEEQVIYETLTEETKNVNGKITPKTAKVWPAVARLLHHWKTDDYDLGPVTSWTPKDILIIDSFTFLGEAAMNYHKNLNSRLGQPTTVKDWGPTQSYLRDILSMLHDTSVKCNVILTAHIDYVYEETKDDKGWVTKKDLVRAYPSAPGVKLSPQVGMYFNSMLQTERRGFTKRVISTQPTGVIELKNSNPHKVKREYPIETGLADFFRDVRS